MQVIRKLGAIRAAVLIFSAGLAGAPAAAQDGNPAAAIREILSAGAPPVTDIDAALGPDSLAALKAVYAARNDRPLWLDALPAARTLLDRLARPDVTIGPKLRPLLDDARARLDAADLPTRAGADLLLTALYGATAQALNPEGPSGFAEALHALAATTDLAALLPEPESPKVETPKVETPATEPPAAEPAPSVRTLKAVTLEEWPSVPDGPKLQLGDSGPRVEALGRRLLASGDLKAAAPGAMFDAALKSALEHFQARHGLPADGVMGAATLAALNVPAKERSATFMANLRRSPDRNWGDRYLVINIPAATYRLVIGGRDIAAGPALVGATATPTPMLDGSIDRIVLRPSYRIPQSVADRQLWPRQEQDALYFVNHGIRVTDEGLRQVPGAGNPLGVAKLLLAGNDRIALHGVPNAAQSQDAFKAPDRHTTLGCVALPDVAAVVKPLLLADPAWPAGRIDGMLAAGGTETVTLAQPLPVHFVYDTAWLDQDGTLEFRPDVYGWDKAMPAGDPNPVPDPCGS